MEYGQNHLVCNWIAKPSSEYLDNCIFNRLDLSYRHGISWLLLNNGISTNIMPVYINSGRAWISLLQIPLNSSELGFLFKFIFSSKKEVQRISFKTTDVDPADSWKWTIENRGNAWFLALDDNYEEVLKRSSGKTRYDLRYDKKRLIKEFGDIQIKSYHICDVPIQVLELYLRLKEQQYVVPPNENTIEKLTNNPKLDITDVYALCLNSEIIAIQLNSEHGGIANLVNTTYDKKYRDFSPGRLLYVGVIGILINKNRKILYLGSGNDWYKRLFGAMKTDYWVGDSFRDEMTMKAVIENGCS